MSVQTTYDECYFLNYDSCTDLHIYEIGKHACPPAYSYGPIIRNHYIFHYILNGRGILNIKGQKYVIAAHHGFIISPNTLAYYEADKEDPWNYIWVHLDGPKTTEYFQKAGLNAENPKFTPLCYPNSIGSIMHSLLVNYSNELFCIGKIYELFDCIIKFSITRSPSTVNPQLAYMKTIINFIHFKYNEPIHMDDIAHVCSLERSYMTRLFKNTTGHTPQEYLTSYRMKTACHMLEEEYISIQNIAYSVGYRDPFTFSKAFKRYIGLSPSEYRIKHDNKI
ncbi:MAG: helix-turn-helix domain-containing protein [Velocimicrobium sp.]